MTLLLILQAIFVLQFAPYDDDEAMTSMNALIFTSTFWIVMVTLLLCLAASTIGVFGAITFNKWMVGVTAAAYCVGVVMGLVFMQRNVVIYSAFFAYPHFFLVKEIQQGIMTKQNYDATERMSCCCV
jgi:hypothetical protein